MKKILKKSIMYLFMIATLSVVLCFGASALRETGQCGNNVYWSYNAEIKELTISGSGATYSYDIDTAGPFCGDSIKNVVIENGITELGDMLFYGCDDVESVTIPESVVSIRADVFSCCDSLKKFEIDPDNMHFSNDDDGILFNKDKTELLQYTLGSERNVYYVPESVTTIGAEAFFCCNNLTDIIIPDSVTTIKHSAFAYCNGIKKITVPDSVTTLGSAFYYCENLEEVTLPSELSVIDQNTFYGCTKLKAINIPESVKEIGIEAFAYCTDLSTVTIPKKVKEIKAYVFQKCSSLEEVKIPDGITCIGERSFEDCSALTEITVPDSVITIDSIAFSGCTNLTSFIIPNNVTTMGDRVFADCINLKSVTVGSSLESIKPNVFDGCTAMTNITFALDENNQSKISSMPDLEETRIKEIVLPKSIKIAGDYVFPRNIKKVTFCNSECEIYATCGLKKKYNHTIIGFKGSTAEKVAERMSAEFIDVETVHNHNYKMTDRKIARCTCGKEEIISLALSTTKYIYDGKNKTPKLTVKDSNGKMLTKNVDYKISVASKRAGIGRYTVKVTLMGNYSGSKNLFFYILPGKLATVKSASQGTSSNKLTWSEVPGAVGYTLYYYSNSKKAYVKINTTTNTTYTVRGLLTGTKYTFKIVAYGKTAAGKVYDSETYALLKSATKTKTPELTKVTASSTKGKAYVYHTDVKGETGYTVYYSTSKTTGFKKYANFKADTTRCDITKLTSGKTYYFKVRTYIKTDSGYVYSPWSNIKGVKVK